MILKGGKNAVLQYTFIGEPGTKPVSLRQALLDAPDPKLLTRLFEMFGPNWWMQRKPWTFRLAQEYDSLLPPHWLLEPEIGKGEPLDGRKPPGSVKLSIGDLVTPQHFRIKSGGGFKDYMTLLGETTDGQPALRVRWLAKDFPKNSSFRQSSGQAGRVIATRLDLLRAYTANFDLMGLPDPLEKLPEILQELVNGTSSIIHGDLNLENVLIGPGGMVWLIDFATTREGHPLMDFAHLEAEVIAHVIAPQAENPRTFLGLLDGLLIDSNQSYKNAPSTLPTMQVSVLSSIHDIAFKCLANPSQPREYWLALYMSCLGALKYRNLDEHQKYFLYLTAAYIGEML